MIALIQRVKSAKVIIDKNIEGEICSGLLIYVGFENNDNLEKINWAINKIINLRMFSDKEGKMNLSLLEINGEVLTIPNFTLPCDLNDSGRRPSFSNAASPLVAEDLYNKFNNNLKEKNVTLALGRFGAMMDIESVADGPVNFILRH